MEGSDFIKKLKKSLEEGKADASVNRIHYDILNKATELQGLEEEERSAARREAVVKRKAQQDYVNEVDDFVRDSNIVEDKKQDALAHLETVRDFLDGGIESAAEVKTHNEDVVNKEVIKNKLEVNRLNIKLLNEEIVQLQAKIQKNTELIEFLNLENKKYGG